MNFQLFSALASIGLFLLYLSAFEWIANALVRHAHRRRPRTHKARPYLAYNFYRL